MQETKEIKSKFTGHWFGLWGIGIVCNLITIISLTLLYPVAVVLKAKWYASHTIIDGEQQVFVGGVGSLYGNYIKWFLLSLITIGLYWQICGRVAVKKWEVRHTHLQSNLSLIKDQD